MTTQISLYLVYLVTAIAMTWGLAAMLYKNGAIFIEDVFHDRPAVGEAINKLLVTGFFMLNLGYAFLIFKNGQAADNLEALELLVTKLGLLIASLGVIHFINMAIIWSVRKRATWKQAPPLAPTTFVPPPPKPAGAATNFAWADAVAPTA